MAVPIGGDIWGFLLILIIFFFGVPLAVAFRFFDKRSLVEIEEVVLENGAIIHRQFTVKIDSEKEYPVPGLSGRTFTPNDLYRDHLKRKKWLYYYIYGYRARCLVIFKGSEKKPITYSAPQIPGNILYIARTSTVLKRGLTEAFKEAGKMGAIIVVILVIIAAFLILSWLQAGGSIPVGV